MSNRLEEFDPRAVVGIENLGLALAFLALAFTRADAKLTSAAGTCAR